MRVQQVWGIIRNEWWAFLIVAGFSSFVVLMSLYRIGSPQDFEIWQYAPPAVPTLAIIESVPGHHRSSNYLTILAVWLTTRVITIPQYVFIVLYVCATVGTAIVAYGVARVTTLQPMWAIVLALAFTLAPARFWFGDISNHWWIAIPLVWLIAYQWWYQPLRTWRHVYPYMLPLGLIPWLGWDQLLWSGVWLLLAAMIASAIRPDWSWRQLAYAMLPLALTTLVLQRVYPIELPNLETDGIRLLDMVVPHRTHWLPLLAQMGERLYQLEIPRTSTVYGGLATVVGLTLLIVRAIRQLVAPQFGIAQPLFVCLIGLVLLATINGWMQLFVWIGLPIASPRPVQLMVVFSGLYVFVQWIQQFPRFARYAVVLICGVVLIDQVPSTNIMWHMRQTSQHISTSRITDGAWFGQQALPADVVSVTGLSVIEPGYGRWSDTAIADRIQIVLRNPLPTSVTLEIRARGVGINVGTPIVVRIGTQEQIMILDTTVRPYMLTFTQSQGSIIEILPQPVDIPPAGDVRRIGVFLQSIRVVSP